ncbi:MAG: fumarylacetoacetate hydrolase family protein [Flavobacteriales bacterium]|nr:fumarylacetoacetate hydrolase family protein [Flavobacteriales bacterium]
MKIICVGKNYYSALAGAPKPTTPLIFLKPDSAILPSGNPFFIPEFSQKMMAEVEIVIRICRLGKFISAKFAHKYYDAVTVGVDFTAEDVQKDAIAKGLPWELSKGFDGSAVIGHWMPIEDFSVEKIHFSMDKNGEPLQAGCSDDLIFSVDKIIEYVSEYYTLKIGDVIFTGAPCASVQVAVGDVFSGKIENKDAFTLKIK